MPCLEKIVIAGGKRLHGAVDISGAKNAAVAIIPATILAQDVCRIENIPNISVLSYRRVARAFRARECGDARGLRFRRAAD